VCEPVTLASAALSGAGQVMAHQAEGQAVAGRNRAKLRNFEEQNEQYKKDVMFDRAQYRNEIIQGDIDYDIIHRSMVDQWTEQDLQLKELFAENDQNVEKAMIEMYENEYAGTQTGRTAARLAGKSAVKMGQERSRSLHNLMMAEERSIVSKDVIRSDAENKTRSTYDQIRFAPVHGARPRAPEMEPKPSSAGLILGLASTGVGAYSDFRDWKGTDAGEKWSANRAQRRNK
tara:strand:+ start:33 stop:725 length:693 start_codon:yes stop_codon:yes gene_type:complete